MPEYRAISFVGAEGCAPVVLAVAPANEIEQWAGIPQRVLMEGQETIGFQREQSLKRISQIAAFFGDSKNVAQNPLLCASRSSDAVSFTPDEGSTEGAIQFGTLSILEQDLSGLPLEELFGRLELELCRRQPALVGASVSPLKLSTLQDRVQDEHGVDLAARVDPDDDGLEVQEDPSEADDSLELFASETHILEFWEDVKARQILLQAMEPEVREPFNVADSFLGFPREMLCSYLKPVLLVDGQHRLLGALQSARSAAEQAVEGDEFMERLGQGMDPDELVKQAFAASCRLLPVSVLMSDEVAEHVFQFVVVNQKATPVGKALLGTIVGTSLTEDELESVSTRLAQAQINVADSRAVAWFTRDPDSAFRGLVQQGLEAEGNTKLPWTVVRDLLSIFRTLQGGKLPAPSRIDYSDLWKRRHLTASQLVRVKIEDVEQDEQLQRALEYWQQMDGPWRRVANAFFLALRDHLSDETNPSAPNAWGTTASNLFNKVSLTILAADFFQYLTDTRQTIDSAEHCSELVAEWLSDVDIAYFNRDWRLSGVKKDSPGIRKRWSEMWVDYRKDPSRLPNVNLYRSAMS